MKKSTNNLEQAARVALNELAELRAENRDLTGRLSDQWRAERAGVLRDTTINDETAARLLGDLDLKLARVPNRVARNEGVIAEKSAALEEIRIKLFSHFSSELDLFFQELARGYRQLLAPTADDASIDGLVERHWPHSRWERVFTGVAFHLDRGTMALESTLSGLEALRAARRLWESQGVPFVKALEAVKS